jgi:transposase
MPAQTKRRIDLDSKDLEALLERVKAAVDAKDYELLERLVESFVYLSQLIEDKETTIGRLRKILFGPQSEKTEEVLKGKGAEGKDEEKPGGPESTGGAGGVPEKDAEGKSPEEGKREKPPGHGRNGAKDYEGAEKVSVRHEGLKPGDACPASRCEGRVYRQGEPGVIVRLVGQAPVAAKIWELEKLRCSLCGEVYTAKAPEGVGEEKYDASSASMIGLLKYGSGLPFNRLEKLEGSLGIPLPAATQWEIVKECSGALEPVYEELIREAAQGEVVHNDDTPMRILAHMGKRREKREARGEERPDHRSVFTTGIVSMHEGHEIVLFFTGQKHAGENLEEVLQRRAADLGPPIQMSDGLDRNQPGEFETIVANCLCHSRRKYVDVVENFPKECRHVLETLRAVYRNDAAAKERALGPEERLGWHKAQSGPLMEELKIWLTAQIAERKVEPNSGLGEAIGYMLKRWERLTLFLRVARAPLDNNIVHAASGINYVMLTAGLCRVSVARRPRLRGDP